MADSVNQIVPSTIAPERSAIRYRAGSEMKKTGKSVNRKTAISQKPFHCFPLTDAVDDERAESSKDKTKGKILDIDV